MIVKSARIRRHRLGFLSALAGAALLGGCADGVEINSPLLDAVGLSTAALSKKEEPRLAPRAPLVMPPSTQRLPEPGEAAPVATAAVDPAWPKDPEQERASRAAQKEAAQRQYCRDGNWKERAMDKDFGGMQGPEGKCGSIFSTVGGFLSGGSTPDSEVGGP